jgi:hypothetical protein
MVGRMKTLAQPSSAWAGTRQPYRQRLNKSGKEGANNIVQLVNAIGIEAALGRRHSPTKVLQRVKWRLYISHDGSSLLCQSSISIYSTSTYLRSTHEKTVLGWNEDFKPSTRQQATMLPESSQPCHRLPSQAENHLPEHQSLKPMEKVRLIVPTHHFGSETDLLCRSTPHGSRRRLYASLMTATDHRRAFHPR